MEAFFLVHSPCKQTPSESNAEAEQPLESQEEALNTLGASLATEIAPKPVNVPPDQQKFLHFAGKSHIITRCLRFRFLNFIFFLF